MKTLWGAMVIGFGTFGAFSFMVGPETNPLIMFTHDPCPRSSSQENSFEYFSQQTTPCSTTLPEVSILDLLGNTSYFHHQQVLIRGLITQPELHLDKTELFLDFVFRLSQGTESIVVYGRHNRTLGPPAIRLNESVEIIGTFFKEQKRNGARLFNVLEASSVTPYPSPIPEST